jgi:hypothetical protein
MERAQMIRKTLAAAGFGFAMVLATTTPAAAAPAVERDYANTTGSVTDPTVCVWVSEDDFNAGMGCFKSAGDILFAADNKSDGHSVALHWLNYQDGTLYRQGYCIQTHGTGAGGTCNKNFIENSSLWIQACSYEASTNREVDCGPLEHTYA